MGNKYRINCPKAMMKWNNIPFTWHSKFYYDQQQTQERVHIWKSGNQVKAAFHIRFSLELVSCYLDTITPDMSLMPDILEFMPQTTINMDSAFFINDFECTCISQNKCLSETDKASLVVFWLVIFLEHATPIST